jgi:hypothetical protein
MPPPLVLTDAFKRKSFVNGEFLAQEKSGAQIFLLGGLVHRIRIETRGQVYKISGAIATRLPKPIEVGITLQPIGQMAYEILQLCGGGGVQACGGGAAGGLRCELHAAF